MGLRAKCTARTCICPSELAGSSILYRSSTWEWCKEHSPPFTGSSVKSPTDFTGTISKPKDYTWGKDSRGLLTFSTEIFPAMHQCTIASHSSLLGLHLSCSNEFSISLPKIFWRLMPIECLKIPGWERAVVEYRVIEAFWWEVVA